MNEASKKAAQSILSQQAAKGAAPQWGVAEHIACLSNRIIEILGERIDPAEAKTIKADLRAALKEDGLGSNASQFRQLLVKESLLPKGEAAATASYE